MDLKVKHFLQEYEIIRNECMYIILCLAQVIYVLSKSKGYLPGKCGSALELVKFLIEIKLRFIPFSLS